MLPGPRLIVWKRVGPTCEWTLQSYRFVGRKTFFLLRLTPFPFPVAEEKAEKERGKTFFFPTIFLGIMVRIERREIPPAG